DSSGSPRSMSRTEFVDLAWSSVGRGSKEEYGLLFDSEEERVDWGGLSSFLLQELSDKVKNSRTRSGPRWKPVRTLTCPHRDPVQKVLYLHSLGQYLTVSKGGTVCLRDREDMSLLHTHRLQNSTVTPKDLWVTDMVLLHNVHKIAVSFTSKEVCFYDILSHQDFRCKYKLQGLIFTPWCLDYWVDPSDPDQAVLTIGDIGGQVSALYFTSAQISLFERLNVRMDSDSADIIQWDELVRGKHRSCYTVTHRAHTPAWVRKVCYLGSLEAFVSCSTQPQSSVVIGWREKESRSLRVTSFFTKRGVWDMDHHRELNLIATAGVDHQVLLWNPCVTSGPVCVLSGHTGPVTAVRFMQAEQQLISYSKDKVLCLWDISRQLCVHRLAGVFPKTQEDTHTLLLFRQAVSSDSASSVICWRVDTGQKVKQFRSCHGNAEISTMALDGTQTRLFTAGADGEVKVWDFNGRCLHRMNAGLGRSVDISQVLLLRRSVLVMGWDRMFTVFRLHSFSRSYVEPSEWKGGVQHRSDILILVRMEKKMLITPSPSLDCSLYRDAHLKVPYSFQHFAQAEPPDSCMVAVTMFSLTFLQKFGQPSVVTPASLSHFSPNFSTHAFTFVNKSLPVVVPFIDCMAASSSVILKSGVIPPEAPDFPRCPQSSSVRRERGTFSNASFFSGNISAAGSNKHSLMNSPSENGGADLVSCGGSGVVRLWNSAHSRLVGQFTAHNSDLGSIVMTVSPCGKYLVTADREGTLKTWDIQHYYLELHDGITDEPPKLLSSFRPHLDRVMHLETCLHGNRLLVLSASSDCSVALSYLHGDNVGLFGQEEQWCLERTGPLHPQQEAERKPREEGGERSPPNETLPDPGPSAGGGEGGVKDEGEDCGSIAGDSRKHSSR
ncbi:hypothetical protein JOQ06_017249, partial [Pogonophryne albipinna]